MELLSRIQTSCSLLNEFCNKKIFVEDGLSDYYEKLISKQLVANFEYLNELNVAERLNAAYGTPSLIDLSIGSIDEALLNKKNNHLRNAIDAIQPAIDYSNGSFYLFGSVVTGDSVDGWSDIDSMLLVNDQVLRSPAALVELRQRILFVNKKLVELDPLQHHGVLVQPIKLLEYYPDTSLPIKSLGPILGDNNKTSLRYLEIQTDAKLRNLDDLLKRIQDHHAEGVMRHHPYQGEYLLDRYQNSQNAMYQLKYYLGLFTLLPSMVAGALDQESYKPAAINSVYGKLNESSRDWLNRITDLRENWDADQNYDYIKNNKIPPQVYEYVPENYFEIGAKFAKNIQEILKASLQQSL